MKVKASAGNVAKHAIITKRFPNQTTITSKELVQVSTENPKELLAADGRTSLAYYITRLGTGKRGVYHLPTLVNGFFITPEDDVEVVSKPVTKKKKKVEESAKKDTL